MPMWVVVAVFVGSTVIIAVVGSRFARLADELADVTGWGEALFGAVLLGGSTSLPGIVASTTTAADGHPELAVSNAVGGIAAQTVFLAFADIAHRRANLEHAAASVENLLQAALLATLLAVPIVAMATPEVHLLGIHPASFVLLLGYVLGLRLISGARDDPPWKPTPTSDTEVDEPNPEWLRRPRAITLWSWFAVAGVIVAASGWLVAISGVAIGERTGLSDTLVGMLFTAIATSLPELVTAVAAVRQGALTLAVGGIIGGNTFDVLFLAFSDAAYREGSIYHAISDDQLFLIALTILLTGIIELGLLRRERRGPANIGFESCLVILLYFGAVGMLVARG